MKKINYKGILIIFMFITALTVLYVTFSDEIDNKLSLNNKVAYPLATVDILTDLKQDLNIPSIGNPSISIVNQFNTSVFSSIPKEAPIYNYEKSNFTSRENELNIIKILGFQETQYEPLSDPVLGRFVSVSNKLGSLSIYEDQGMMAYSRNIETELSYFPQIVDTNAYIEKSKSYLSTIGIDLSAFTFSKIKYYSVTGPEAEETYSPTRAKIIEVLYLAKVLGFPILDNSTDQNGNLVRVWLDVNQNIIRVDYQNTGKIGEKTSTFKLKTTEQVINDVNQGKLKIIKTETPFGQKITATSIQSLKLAYYAIDGFLVPVYILQAQSKTETGTIGPTYLIMEAVAR
ncbi:MAG: hypothetical protein A2698_02005 [Candidatus Levybacteria bacterium RIFCSPHIGHO2_01_FULL_42_15]|nr:MAG: hypothetical protein A2698_02005 [Candidatus Levybacteria bacterium RIFCSPHIGHO2_01_FULL_42_15]